MTVPTLGFVCSGRLALDPAGRPVVVATTGDQVTDIGTVFLVLNICELGWFEPRGRLPTAREQAEARAPYESPRSNRWDKAPVDVPDDELDERAALEAARREQQRAPVDLFQAVAA